MGYRMPKIKQIDHIAIVVNDTESALSFWRDVLGLELDHVANISEQKSEVAFLRAGSSEIELVNPTSDDTGIARYLDKHGPGMHHICLQVEDIDGILEDLRNKGVRLINETPLQGKHGQRYAFIHPESACGVLVELYEYPEGDS
jgi:methylmalonyl-CoA/ethylmalonyl-CoA epimerase